MNTKLSHRESLLSQLREELQQHEHLEAECNRLNEVVKQLEEECKQLRDSLAEVTTERDNYLRSVYAYAEQQLREEDLTSWAQEIQTLAQDDKGVDLVRFIKELEQSSKQAQR